LKEIVMNTVLNGAIEKRLAKDYRAVVQQAVVEPSESGLRWEYSPTRARTNQLHRSRAALMSAQIDDGFRPFRVF
jgi:hypothetical protein